MNLVDLHCHLDLYPDFEQLIEEIDNRGIYTLAVTTTPRAWPKNKELADQTKYVRAALGFHPQLVEAYENELSIWDRYLREARFVGEVGLDAGPRFYKSMPAQMRVFEHILYNCAQYGDKILSVHSVRASKEVLDAIEKHLPLSRGRVVLHWFTGSKAQIKRAVHLGCYFSVNATMLEKKRGKELIRMVPFERILTETDGPFTSIEGGEARPWHVVKALAEIARLKDVTVENASTKVLQNLKALLT